ncbi:MAG: DUF2480 family protein [Bacteroidetes bacterium]|nr:MAG: DUF2480 family protein [Bacteroidota bacterium]
MTQKDKPLVNRVERSGLLTLDLADFYPEVEFATFDLKDFLFMELILKEKDFREGLKNHDWSQYEGKVLLVGCSADAIIPMWAYMLVASHAQPFARELFFGNREAYLTHFFSRTIRALDVTPYIDQRIVIKGCGSKPIPPAAYLELTARLRPVARSIMYGEPCSTVPIFKKSPPTRT